MITLGSKVKDTVTGFIGIATGVTIWLNGCIRYGVQSTELKDGRPVDIYWVDEPQIEVVLEEEKKEIQPKHGPRCDPSRDR